MIIPSATMPLMWGESEILLEAATQKCKPKLLLQKHITTGSSWMKRSHYYVNAIISERRIHSVFLYVFHFE